MNLYTRHIKDELEDKLRKSILNILDWKIDGVVGNEYHGRIRYFLLSGIQRKLPTAFNTFLIVRELRVCIDEESIL